MDFDDELTQQIITQAHGESKYAKKLGKNRKPDEYVTKQEYDDYVQKLERFLKAQRDRISNLEKIIKANHLTDGEVNQQTGKVLCKICQKRVHDPKWDCCFDCKSSDTMDYHIPSEGTVPCPVLDCDNIMAPNYNWCKSCDTRRRKGVRLQLPESKEPENDGRGSSLARTDELEI